MDSTGDGGTTAATGTSGPTDTTGPTTGETGTTYVLPDPIPDEFGSEEMCDAWLQDCPPGEKCSPYNDGHAWAGAYCVPVARDPVGVDEPCRSIDGVSSGYDDCELGAVCWVFDTRTGEGHCIALCTGTPEDPACATGSACETDADSGVSVCTPLCDPLAPEPCPYGGDLCVPRAGQWFCAQPEKQEAGLHAPCDHAEACSKGLACVEPAAAAECEPLATGCCEPYCDIMLAATCPGAGQTCAAWYPPGEAPPGHEKLGVCRVPA